MIFKLILKITTKNASLVQLVERWSPKPNVEGSSPSGRVYLNSKSRIFLEIVLYYLYIFILFKFFKTIDQLSNHGKKNYCDY
jgi:hypothetical protein